MPRSITSCRQGIPASGDLPETSTGTILVRDEGGVVEAAVMCGISVIARWKVAVKVLKGGVTPLKLLGWLLGGRSASRGPWAHVAEDRRYSQEQHRS